MTRRTVTEFDDDEDGKILYSTRREISVDQWEGNWLGQDPYDMTGREIRPGDWLVKTFQSGRSCNLEIKRVREVRVIKPRSDFDERFGGGVPATVPRVYLDDSKVPVQYPGRCLVVDWDPEAEKVRPVAPGSDDGAL